MKVYLTVEAIEKMSGIAITKATARSSDNLYEFVFPCTEKAFHVGDQVEVMMQLVGKDEDPSSFGGRLS